jgi:uncharacterized protein (TIGR00725 family)
MLQRIIGVMGGGTADNHTCQMAFDLGKAIAENGWILLNGGRCAGVMHASAQGAKQARGLTIGILPDRDRGAVSEFIDIPIVTGMSDARNLVNILSSDVVVACRGSAGTISEVALALKNSKRVILLDFPIQDTFRQYVNEGLLTSVQSVEEVISHIREYFKKT